MDGAQSRLMDSRDLEPSSIGRRTRVASWVDERFRDPIDWGELGSAEAAQGGGDLDQANLDTDSQVGERVPADVVRRVFEASIDRRINETKPDAIGVTVVAEREGVVTHVDDEHFEGLFRGADASSTVFTADFSVEDVDPDDLDLLEVGALFRLVTCEVPVGRRRGRTSLLQFRRLPPIRDQHLEEAHEFAAKMRQKLGID